MDKPHVSIVSEKTMMSDKNGINFGDAKMSVDAIPDLVKLTKTILEIILFLEDPDNDELVTSSESTVKMILNNKYADTVPFGILSLLTDKKNRYENVEQLMCMFAGMNKAKKGQKSLDSIEKELYDDINMRYVYSKYGSKDEFEKELTKNVNKKKIKK